MKRITVKLMLIFGIFFIAGCGATLNSSLKKIDYETSLVYMSVKTNKPLDDTLLIVKEESTGKRKTVRALNYVHHINTEDGFYQKHFFAFNVKQGNIQIQQYRGTLNKPNGFEVAMFGIFAGVFKGTKSLKQTIDLDAYVPSNSIFYLGEIDLTLTDSFKYSTYELYNKETEDIDTLIKLSPEVDESLLVYNENLA
jgi:hypothetical protein